MNYPEQIITIDSFSEESYKQKGSTFTAQVYPCVSGKDAIEILAAIKKEYYDATHHCFAYKLIDEKFKYSDDGEPNGTAGIRILNAIEHFNLLNVIVVVIRYYGGTKLGVGPLGKAYYLSSYNVLENSNKIERILYQRVSIESEFNFVSHIHRILSMHNATIENSDYKSKAIFHCYIKPSELNTVSTQLTNLSKGKIKITLGKAIHYR